MSEFRKKCIQETLKNLEQATLHLRKVFVELEVRGKNYDHHAFAKARQLLDNAYDLQKYLREQL